MTKLAKWFGRLVGVVGDGTSGSGWSHDEARRIVSALYRGILAREPDPEGLAAHVQAMIAGCPLADVIRGFVTSDEFESRRKPALEITVTLPDLTQMHPRDYVRLPDGTSVYHAATDEHIYRMAEYIECHRYYDSFGVWAPKIDLDKRVTAALVAGLGARSCLELGCFTGPVLSLLAQQGVEICGVEVSHLAMVLALPNARPHIRFGDLLGLTFERRYDVLLAMDVLEHLNPLELELYVERMAQLIEPHGVVYLNSPMFGEDDIFGSAFEPYLPEWQAAGERVYWRHMHCDAKGWPMHGHLVWASPKWWEAMFKRHGLVRDREVERVVHKSLRRFFQRVAPARRSLFVLHRPGEEKGLPAIEAGIGRALAEVWDDAMGRPTAASLTGP